MFLGGSRKGKYKMSETYVVDTGKAREAEDWKPILFKILIAILALFLIAEVAFYVVVVPATSTIKITIQGAPGMGYDELCSLAGLTGNEKWIRFDTALTASILASNPLFESVSVEKKFPDRVMISLVKRVPVAIALGTIKGRTVPVEIDKSGVAFRIGQFANGSSLPLITGLTFDNPVPGMRLNARLKPLLQDLADLEAKNPALLSSVSEIKINEKTYGGYDLVVYPVHTQIRVLTDKTLNEDTLQYMMLVLDVVKDMSLSIDEIDIRAGTVSYRQKGEQL